MGIVSSVDQALLGGSTHRAEVDEHEYITVGHCKKGLHKQIRDTMHISIINIVADTFQVTFIAKSLLVSNTDPLLQIVSKPPSLALGTTPLVITPTAPTAVTSCPLCPPP